MKLADLPFKRPVAVSAHVFPSNCTRNAPKVEQIETLTCPRPLVRSQGVTEVFRIYYGGIYKFITTLSEEMSERLKIQG